MQDETIVAVCDRFFEFKTQKYSCENIVHSIDLALRELGLIRGMNEQTIQMVNKATLIVIQYMKKYIDEGMDEDEAFEKAFKIATQKLSA